MSQPDRPTRMKATLNRALSDATRTSHASASASPPPVAAPFTAAITGLDSVRSLVTSDAICCWPRIAAGGPPPPSADLRGEVTGLLEVEARTESAPGSGEDHAP